MARKMFCILGGLIIIAIIIVYWQYPFTQKGCENLGKKIKQEINEHKYCNLASDCLLEMDLGCSFECEGFFNETLGKEALAKKLTRFNRRCKECGEKCFTRYSHPACLSHTCTVSGGKVVITVDKNKYTKAEEIKLHLEKNIPTEVKFNFPVSLCLRPVIMRLEEYNEKTQEWLSAGVGLLFAGSKVVFYRNPDMCALYKIEGCQPEKAHEFIDEQELIISSDKDYTIPLERVESCDEDGQETKQLLEGRFRAGVYYEDGRGVGEQIYSNEFVVEH